MKLTGIAASPGIGVGPIVRYEREDYALRDAPIAADQADRELATFRASVDASREELRRIRDDIAAELGEEEARIYDTHLLILDDPELWKAIEHGAREERRSPAATFHQHLSRLAARLDEAGSELIRERRSDVVDVERRVMRHVFGDSSRALAALPEPSIIVAHDLGPSEVALLDRALVLGFVTELGGRTSHSAIVARGRGIPAVVSARGVMQHARSGDTGAVDGYAGEVELNPDGASEAHFRARRTLVDEETATLEAIRHEPAVTLDGRAIELGVNIELPGEAEHVFGAGADGVGLFRTEFFYLNRPALPTEEEQYRAYRDVAERVAPRPVIFRTMDLGGDKVASYLGVTHEANPFLGWRGIRFALNHPEMFRTQLRALYRASVHGRARIMFPMVSSEDELLRAQAQCREATADLTRHGTPFDADIEMGVMIETPSSVWMADALARHVKFLSIGSNDLTQYTLAIDRDNTRLAHLYEPLDPSVLRSIHHTVEAGHAAGCWVGICGEMAGDPSTAVLLVGMGVDELSMSSFDLPRVKAAIRNVRFADAAAIATEALRQSSADGVKRLLRDRAESMLPAFLLARRDASS